MKRTGTVLAATAAAFTLFTSQASAIDWEKDVATATTTTASPPWSGEVTAYATARFTADGDWFWVKDNAKDGKSAVIKWELRNTSGTLVRGGSVWMTEGVGEGRYQNKDFTEGYKLYYKVCPIEWGSTWYEQDECGVGLTVTA